MYALEHYLFLTVFQSAHHPYCCFIISCSPWWFVFLQLTSFQGECVPSSVLPWGTARHGPPLFWLEGTACSWSLCGCGFVGHFPCLSFIWEGVVFLCRGPHCISLVVPLLWLVSLATRECLWSSLLRWTKETSQYGRSTSNYGTCKERLMRYMIIMHMSPYDTYGSM